MPRTLRENGATTVCKVAVSYTRLAVSVAWPGLYHLQRFLVGKRRCSGHWLVQYGAMAAYYLPAPLAFYAAKAVYYTSNMSYSSTSIIHKFTPLLVACILVMLCITILVPTPMGVLLTNTRANSLRERPQDRYNFLMGVVFLGCVCVEWEWARTSSANLRGLLEHLYFVAVMVVHFLGAFVFLFVNPSESTLDCQTKAVADYMNRESSKSSSTSSPFFDDDANSSLQLDCCRYPFMQRKDGQWVRIKDLFHQCHDLRNEDQDIWLSYSLSRLLARRYYGFHCAEEGDDKVRRFALADLGTRDGYKRAFTIVEVQMAFLHDYFFTTSLPITELGSGYVHAAQKLTGVFPLIISIFFSAIPNTK